MQKVVLCRPPNASRRFFLAADVRHLIQHVTNATPVDDISRCNLMMKLPGPTAQPNAPAQQVLKVGSTGVPFTFLDTKSNQIQGVMVDIITEIRAASEASADSIRGLRTVGSIPRERRGVAPHQCRGANDLRLLL